MSIEFFIFILFLKASTEILTYLGRNKFFQGTQKISICCKIYTVAVFNPSLQDVETAVTYFGKWCGRIQVCTGEKKKAFIAPKLIPNSSWKITVERIMSIIWHWLYYLKFFCFTSLESMVLWKEGWGCPYKPSLNYWHKYDSDWFRIKKWCKQSVNYSTCSSLTLTC